MGLSPLWQKIDDHQNPVLVKEIRQAVRSRFVVASLVILLLLLVFGSGAFILDRNLASGGFQSHGRKMFVVMYAMLMGITAAFVPIYTAIRFVGERNHNSTDLMFITTIHPNKVIAGKVMVGMVISLMLFSVCAPFLFFSYLLRGIEIPTVMLVLALSFLLVMGLIYVMILLSSLSVNRLMRTLFALASLFMLFWAVVGAVAIASELMRGGIQQILSDPTALPAFLAFLVSYLCHLVLVHFICVALIAPTWHNKMLPVRGIMAVIWLITLSINYSLASRFPGEFLLLSLFTGLGYAALVLLTAISEREDPGPRVRRQIPKNPILRPIAFLFYSGMAGGVLWSMLIAALSIWFFTHMYSLRSGVLLGFGRGFSFLPIYSLTLYGFAYCFFALFLQRSLLKNRIHPNQTWALAGILIAVGTILPLIFGFFKPNSWRDPLAWKTGVFFDTVHRDRMDWHVLASSILFAISLILIFHILLRSAKYFRRLEGNSAEESDAFDDGLSPQAATHGLGAAPTLPEPRASPIGVGQDQPQAEEAGAASQANMPEPEAENTSSSSDTLGSISNPIITPPEDPA